MICHLKRVSGSKLILLKQQNYGLLILRWSKTQSQSPKLMQGFFSLLLFSRINFEKQFNFSLFPKISQNNCSHNSFSDLMGFELLKNLETLVMDGNRISSHSRLPPFPKLHTLSLNKNLIKNLATFVDRLRGFFFFRKSSFFFLSFFFLSLQLARVLFHFFMFLKHEQLVFILIPISFIFSDSLFSPFFQKN